MRFVIAVAVGAVNLGAIKPADFAVGCSRLPQLLHKGLFGVNACEILDGDYRHLDSNINLFAKALAEGTVLAKRVTQFVLLESFAEALGGGRFEDFGEALVGNVSERDLPAMVETASDYAPVVQNCYMCIKGSASPCCVSLVSRLLSLV